MTEIDEQGRPEPPHSRHRRRRAARPRALGRTHPAWGGRGEVSLRWVLTHMVEEYARHNGQADLIRESIDGVTGE